MDSFIQTLARWGQKPASFSPAAWSAFIKQQAPCPFSPVTLPVDESLWGSFWQGDVIAPGYLLPALELAYLRATRLDEANTASSPAAYLQSLQVALDRQPRGVWLAPLPEGWALCIACQSGTGAWQFIWLAGGFIVAGYRDRPTPEPGWNLVPLQGVQIALPPPQADYPLPPWDDWGAEWSTLNQATQIDRMVCLHRVYSHLAGTLTGQRLARWLEERPL